MKMMLDKEFVLLWNHAAIKILDVRHISLTPKDICRPYKLPASMFLYSTGGSAEIQLDFTKYTIDAFHLIHSDIYSLDKQLDFVVESLLATVKKQQKF